MDESLAAGIVAALVDPCLLAVDELAERLDVPQPRVGAALGGLVSGPHVARAGGRRVPSTRGSGHRWLPVWALAKRA
jgi:hypothetical protein